MKRENSSNNEEKKLSAIFSLLEFVKTKEKEEKEKKKKEVLVVLARRFDDGFLKKLEEQIRKFFKLDKERKIKIEIDENIIGGLLIKEENYIFDATVKGLLRKIWTSTKT